MEIKKFSIKNTAIFSLLMIISIGGFTALLSNNQNSSDSSNTNVISNTDGKQVIDLTAKGGYSPRVIEAKANMDIILRVSTNNTFDCSSALTIPSLGVRKNLPVTGKTDIEIKAQVSGSEIDGTCSMGMYNFKIRVV